MLVSYERVQTLLQEQRTVVVGCSNRGMVQRITMQRFFFGLFFFCVDGPSLCLTSHLWLRERKGTLLKLRINNAKLDSTIVLL